MNEESKTLTESIMFEAAQAGVEGVTACLIAASMNHIMGLLATTSKMPGAAQKKDFVDGAIVAWELSLKEIAEMWQRKNS